MPMNAIGTLAVTAAALAIAAQAQAAPASQWRFWNGRELLRNCTASASMRNGCTGYIAGIVDTHETYAASGYGRRLFCPPADVKVGRFRDAVVAFIQARPTAEDNAAAGLTVAALQSAFPCTPKIRERRRR
jgi:hypothetical protein